MLIYCVDGSPGVKVIFLNLFRFGEVLFFLGIFGWMSKNSWFYQNWLKQSMNGIQSTKKFLFLIGYYRGTIFLERKKCTKWWRRLDNDSDSVCGGGKQATTAPRSFSLHGPTYGPRQSGTSLCCRILYQNWRRPCPVLSSTSPQSTAPPLTTSKTGSALYQIKQCWRYLIKYFTENGRPHSKHGSSRRMWVPSVRCSRCYLYILFSVIWQMWQHGIELGMVRLIRIFALLAASGIICPKIFK